MTAPVLHRDADALADAVAEAMLDAVQASDPPATLVLAGGTTPEAAYRRFATALGDRPVALTLSDERWVAPDHPRSNAGLLARCLGATTMRGFVPLWRGGATPAEDARAATRDLTTWPRPVDLVVLGMGDDGHTASLFPDDPELPALLDPMAAPAVHLASPASQPEPRLTHNVASLLDARRILVVLRGRAKLDVLEQALAGTDARAMPIRAVLHQHRVPVDVHATREGDHP